MPKAGPNTCCFGLDLVRPLHICLVSVTSGQDATDCSHETGRFWLSTALRKRWTLVCFNGSVGATSATNDDDYYDDYYYLHDLYCSCCCCWYTLSRQLPVLALVFGIWLAPHFIHCLCVQQSYCLAYWFSNSGREVLPTAFLAV